LTLDSDPRKWAAIYESPRPTPIQYIFRHGAELAREECLARAASGEQWLDAGCGTGHLAAELAQGGLRMIAVDRREEMLAVARGRFGAMPLAPRFISADITHLPLRASTIDGVVATSVTGRLAVVDSFLCEVARILRPGGWAVFSFTNRTSVLRVIGSHLPGRRSWDESLVAPSIRVYAKSEAIEHCTRAGLRVIELRYYNYFLGVGRHMFPPRAGALLAERLLRRRAGSLVARNLLAVTAKTG